VALLPFIGQAAAETFTFQDPLTQPTIVCALKGFIGGVYLIGSPIAGLAIAYAGFLFVRARGSATGLAEAKSTFLHVVLGVALFLGSWLIGVAILNTANLLFPGLFQGLVSC